MKKPKIFLYKNVLGGLPTKKLKLTLKKRIFYFLITKKSFLFANLKLHKNFFAGYLYRYVILGQKKQTFHNLIFKYKTYSGFYKRFLKLKYKLLKKNKKVKKIKYSNLYSTFVNFFIKMGKKSIVESNIEIFLKKTSKVLNLSNIKIILLFFLRLNTKVEVRSIKIRRRVNTIPFLISVKRQKFLALFWFYKAIIANKDKLSHKNKLIFELNNILQNKGIALSFLEKNNQLALKSRSNAHYRW